MSSVQVCLKYSVNISDFFPTVLHCGIRGYHLSPTLDLLAKDLCMFSVYLNKKWIFGVFLGHF